MNTLTKKEISKKLHFLSGIPQSVSQKIVDQVFESISNHILMKKKLSISNFGTFSVKEKKARAGRNLNTGEEVVISARKVISFTPAENLKKAVNNEA